MARKDGSFARWQIDTFSFGYINVNSFLAVILTKDVSMFTRF